MSGFPAMLEKPAPPTLGCELCIHVFEQWEREQKVPYTWRTITNALKAVIEHRVMTSIS